MKKHEDETVNGMSLEELEDMYDLMLAERRWRRSGGKGRPLEQVMRDMGITQEQVDAVPDSDIEIE